MGLCMIGDLYNQCTCKQDSLKLKSEIRELKSIIAHNSLIHYLLLDLVKIIINFVDY